jgi:lambda repressor-like predicted transcriptional regulator
MAVRVRLLSGAVVWEGKRPTTLAALRAAVARACDASEAELALLPGQAPGDPLDEAAWADAEDEELLAVRDAVLGLLPAFLFFVDSNCDEHLPERLRPIESHRHCMMAAVQQRGTALRFASVELRADRAVVLAAVRQSGLALRFASDELRADRAVVLAAVRQCGGALLFASAELRADREVVLAAVRRKGFALQFASVELRADPSVVLAAVENHGVALEHASTKLRADREVVLAAVQCDGQALQFASVELRVDFEVVLASAFQPYGPGWLLKPASVKSRANRHGVFAAVLPEVVPLRSSREAEGLFCRPRSTNWA